MAGNINPNPFTTRPEIDGTFGVVTSPHWIATAVGMGTVERRGHALPGACVPGMFDTWMTMLRAYGTMKLADVLTPAISYAQNGHPLVERANATIRTVEKLFRDHWPTSAAIYLKDGKPAETGKLFTN